MNSFELNKVAGAVLGTLLFAFGTGFVAELIYTPKPAGDAGYALPGGGEGGEHGGSAGGEAAAAPKAEGIAVLLASADAEKGKAGVKACQACHGFEKGGPNKAGPNLWEVVGRKKGSHEGFAYSEAMKAKGGDWGFEELDGFLTKPSEYVKGTKMAYQGIASASERANVIAYLRTLSESPKPLPAAEKAQEPKPDEAKKAEGEKKPDAKAADKPSESKSPESKPEAPPAEKAADPEKTAGEANPTEGEKTEGVKPAESKPGEAPPAEKTAEPDKTTAPAEKPAETAVEGDAKPEEKPGEPKPQ